MTETKTATECMKEACVMAKQTIHYLMRRYEDGEALTDIDIDKLADAVKILDICKRNGANS